MSDSNQEKANRIAKIQELLRGRWVDPTGKHTMEFVSPPFPEGYGEWIIDSFLIPPSFKKYEYFIDILFEGEKEEVYLRTNVGGAEKGTRDRIWVDEVRLAIELILNGAHHLLEYYR